MNREDIIRLAEEAGISIGAFSGRYQRQLERFAALVAAAEREACAKVCEARNMGDNNREDAEAKRCAAAIRSRGEVKP